MFKSILSNIKSLEIESLVDEMKLDGVKERTFAAKVGISGRLTGHAVSESDPLYGATEMEVLPFHVSLATTGEVSVTVAGVNFGDKFTDAKALVFKYNDGVDFRDIKTVGWSLFDVETRLPAVANSSNQHIAIVAGAELGGSTQTIQLDDGQTIHLGGKPKTIVEGWNVPGDLGTHVNLCGGFEVSDEFIMGVVKLKGVLSYDNFFGENQDTGLRMNHTVMMLNPELSLTRNLGKRTSLTLTAGANLTVFNKLRGRETEYETSMDGTILNLPDGSSSGVRSPVKDMVDLGDRSRQPVQVGLKLNF